MTGAASTLEPGAIFADDYRVIRLLAEGGMGAVYVVDQLSTGKSRALKVMLPEIAGDAEMRRRFELEAKIGAKIESEHVVEIQSAGVDETTRAPYLVMELLVGQDLGDRIDANGPLAPGDVAGLFEQLCHAVSAAHEAGIVHRDLKPNNVFLAKTRRAGDTRGVDVKVLDFGIAKIAAESQTKGNHTVGMIGTPQWMAPEQTERGPVTPAADVWALGLILYYVLTGKPYWLSAIDPEVTFTQLLKEVVMGPLPAASVRAREQGAGGTIPDGVDAILARCVVRDPKRRFANASELWSALGPLLPRPSTTALAGAPSGNGSGRSSGLVLEPTAAVAPIEAAFGAPPTVIAPIGVGLPSMPVRPIVIPQPIKPYDEGFGSRLLSHDVPVLYKALGAIALFAVFGIILVVGVYPMLMKKPAPRNPRERADAPIILPTQPMISPSARGIVPGCRLCTTNVTATGGVSKQDVAAAIERAQPIIEQQCFTRKRIGASTTTLAFSILSGKATNRRIEGSSAKDGTDGCLSGALSEVSFPSTYEPTEATATVSYNPSVK